MSGKQPITCQVPATINVGPVELAMWFAMLSDDEQAETLVRIASEFRAWGSLRNERQLLGIAEAVAHTEGKDGEAAVWMFETLGELIREARP